MNREEVESELRRVRSGHLTEMVLAWYLDQELDATGKDLADAHLQFCIMCETRLASLREERAAAEPAPGLSKKDLSRIRRAIEARHVSAESMTAPTARLRNYVDQMTISWKARFARPVQRCRMGEEIWRWQSEDGKFTGRAVLGRNACLALEISSDDLSLKYARFRFRLGTFIEELTLKPVSHSKVSAKLEVPRQSNILDISVEIVELGL